MNRLALFLFLLQLIPTAAYAFHFDVWTSGMSSREAMAIARDKDIPVIREGLVSVNKHFDSNASTKYLDSAHEFYYNSSLLGENTRTNLIFTPVSKFLSTVRIRWAEVSNKNDFRQVVFEMLKTKYGNYVKKEKEIFFETFFWAIDKTNQVSLKTGANQISVEYIDLTAHAVGQKEINMKKDAKRRDAKSKDAGKFWRLQPAK
jgi:hypothetical protein